MPVRALRPLAQRHTRQGQQRHEVPQKTINAREGITTPQRVLSPVRHQETQKTINAREGITTLQEPPG